ncbi:MAG: hypothetical protein M5U08_15545 [Burkholderiales bacterium]|nr:hypothetical protein [Burkholderiales bacterium]
MGDGAARRASASRTVQRRRFPRNTTKTTMPPSDQAASAIWPTCQALITTSAKAAAPSTRGSHRRAKL